MVVDVACKVIKLKGNFKGKCTHNLKVIVKGNLKGHFKGNYKINCKM